MFSMLRKYLGMIKVTEQGDYISISGLPADFINFSINRIWSTSKIATYMFNQITNSQIVFHKFFAPDVLYTLQVVMNDKRARHNSQTIEKVIDMMYRDTWLKNTLVDSKPFLNREKLALFKKNPLPHQIDFFDQYEDYTQRYLLKGYLLGAVPGSGKAHSLDVKLRTPSGFTLMRDIKVGDYVLDRLLSPTKVLGVFPQGRKDIYEFTLEDGRSTEVCLEHLWRTYIDNKCSVIDTKQIQKHLQSGDTVYLDLPKSKGLGLACDLRTTIEYDKRLELLLEGQTYYRSLGCVTSHEEYENHYKLHVQFRCDSKIKVKSIKYIGKKQAQCIQVENDEHLYIVDDYIVTHNTLASIMLSRMLDTDSNFFFVPKNSLDRVWKATFDTEIDESPNYWISNGTKPFEPGYRDYIIHHDHITKIIDELEAKKKYFGTTYINVDESHFFNEIKSARTNNIVTIARDVLESEHTLFMSGTPIKAVGSEAIPLLRIIDPFFHSKVEERFSKIYGKSQSRANDILQNRMGTLTFKVDKATAVGNDVTVNSGYVTIPNGKDYTLNSIRIEMKKFITERMDYYKSERSKYDKEYLRILDLFKKSFVDTRAQKEEFQEYVDSVKLIRDSYDPVLRKGDIVFANRYEKQTIIPKLSNEDKKIFRDCKSVYKYYFLKVQGEALGRVLGKLREQCNIDMLTGLDEIIIRDEKGIQTDTTSLEKEILSTKKKTILFTSFVGVVKEAKRVLEKKGYKPLVVYGETNKELASIVSEFANNIDANPLIATFKSLSTAVPLTMANVTVMLNAPFRDHEFQQAIARTDRVGQDSKVFCTLVYLDTGKEPNISTRSKDIMEWSKNQIEEILGVKVTDDSVALEDDVKTVTDPFESLAEALDIGVPDLVGENEDDDNVVETDKGKLRTKYWNSW